MKKIIPFLVVIIISMDFIVYNIVSDNTMKSMKTANLRTVTLLSDDISELFHRYLGDLNMMAHYYRHSTREEFMRFAKEFTLHHVNEYSYIRLMMPDGRYYATLDGNDKYDVKGGRPYKNIVQEHKRISVNTIHSSALVKNEVYSISVPVLDTRDSVVAIIAAVIPSSVIDKKLESVEADNGEFLVMLDDENNIRVYRDSSYSLTVDSAIHKGYMDINAQVAITKELTMSGTTRRDSWSYHAKDGEEIMLCYAVIPGTPWIVAINTPMDTFAKNIRITLWMYLFASLVVLGFLLVALRLITSKVVIHPLEAINRFSDDFAHGKLYSTETRTINSKDELGTVRTNIEKMQQRLVSVVGGIRSTSNELKQCSDNIINVVQTVDHDAQVLGIAVENISNSVEQVNGSIRLNNDDAEHTRTNSDDIATVIQSLTKASTATFDYMQDIIQKVTVINEITSHTDLLAINASVEASRAGEHGTGFAVVAAEIRKLSELCHRASTEINQLSAQTLSVTRQTVDLVANISPKIQDNAAMVSRIADACNSQLKLTGTISDAVKRLSQLSQNGSLSADSMTVFASVLSKNVEKLNEMMEFFHLDLERDKRRSEIEAEIAICTSEILRLKSKLSNENTNDHGE